MIRYIPFLKAKLGELTAMGELSPLVKQVICPFFDFPRKKPDYDAKAYIETTRRIVAGLKKHWGANAEFYFDDLDIAQTLTVKGENQYAYALRAFKGLQVIPVVTFDRIKHNDVVAQLKRSGEIASNTVAFRAEEGDFEDFDASNDQEYDMASVFNEFGAIDLVLDCRVCTGKKLSETAQQIVEFVRKFCTTFGNVRRVIVTGSSIPASIRDVLDVNDATTIMRQELEIISKARALTEYDLIAGDYTTVSPFYSDAAFKPGVFPKVTAPKLIYSFNHSHYIARGNSLAAGGHDQYFGIIAELSKKAFFRPGNSSGENYFRDKLKRVGKKATNGAVVKPSVVAHISYMVLGAKL